MTLTLRNASLRRVLDMATESIGYQYEVQADMIVVRPGGETSSLETGFFPVTRATVLRLSGTSEHARRDQRARDRRTPAGSGAGPEEEALSGAAQRTTRRRRSGLFSSWRA